MSDESSTLSRFRRFDSPRIMMAIAIVLGGISGLALLAALGAGDYAVGPLKVRVGLQPDVSGRTVIEIPPLGNVEARTHKVPLKLSVSANQIVIDEVEQFVKERPRAADVVAEIALSVKKNAFSLSLRVLLIGLIGGVLAALILRGGMHISIAAIIAGIMTPVLLVGSAALTFKPKAFSEPTLTGALSAAPKFLGPIGEFGERLETYRRQLEVVGTTVFQVYKFLSDRSDLPSDAIRVLHISDLHLNPVGFDLAQSVAKTFEVEAIFDTGDTVAEGNDLESGFVGRIKEFKVPYVWVKGNHDSEATANAVAAQPNAIVLNGTSDEVAGLLIFGVADPLFTPGKSQEVTNAVQRKALEEYAPRVSEMMSQQSLIPDVVLVHSRLIANELLSEVPLIVAGHSHRFSLARTKDSTVTEVGSTGGAGLVSLAPGQGSPYSLQVLYFDRLSKDLLAIDRVQVFQEGARFSVDRVDVPWRKSAEGALSGEG